MIDFVKMADSRRRRITAEQPQANLNRFMRQLHDETDSDSGNSDCNDPYMSDSSDSEWDTAQSPTSQVSI